MFPNSHYESWDARFWQKGYTEAVALSQKCLLVRAQQSLKLPQNWKASASVKEIACELCHCVCRGPEEFVAHCASNKEHKALEVKFMSADYDELLSDKAQRV